MLGLGKACGGGRAARSKAIASAGGGRGPGPGPGPRLGLGLHNSGGTLLLARGPFEPVRAPAPSLGRSRGGDPGGGVAVERKAVLQAGDGGLVGREPGGGEAGGIGGRGAAAAALERERERERGRQVWGSSARDGAGGQPGPAEAAEVPRNEMK